MADVPLPGEELTPEAGQRDDPSPALPAAVRDLLERLWSAGHAAYVVGGSLRDTLRGSAAKDWDLARSLMRRAADLGLFGIAVPEEYGGLDLDKASSLVVVERLARAASFATTFGGQANLCILPLVMFGTDDQKARYLPKLVAGEIIGAYALSESGSGSDALAAKTRAARQPDGTWLLNGEKMWITNGGFADLIIVFAKVDGEQFTAFLVERAFPGVSSGKEEHKMGLHGSSTTPIILQDARVPAGNVLGEVGKGHKVALNTLNYGRFSLGAMCGGGCRSLITDSVKYASTRRQFGQRVVGAGTGEAANRAEREAGGDVLAAGVDRLNDLEKLPPRDPLEHVAPGTGVHGGHQVLLILRAGQHDHPRGRRRFTDAPRGLEPVARHPDVQQRHVGQLVAHLLEHCPVVGARLAAHIHDGKRHHVAHHAADSDSRGRRRLQQLLSPLKQRKA